MNLKKAIKFKELKDFFESKGFKYKSEFGAIEFFSPYGEWIAISESPSAPGIIYLDCNLLWNCGLPNFTREWKDGINLYDYLINTCYPVLRNIKGSSTMRCNPEKVIDYVKNFLDSKAINYIFKNPCDITYKQCAPQRSLFENTIEYKLFSFKFNEIHYGIVLKQFNTISLVRFYNEDNTVFYEYPWHSFCPIYKEGKDYVETTISNFLEFIEQDKTQE